MSQFFRQVNQCSACSLYEVHRAVLKHCHVSLAPVFMRLLQMLLTSGHIPLIWKPSNVIPVPKKPFPSALNDYRPVALTSIPFKCMEHMVLQQLLVASRPSPNPLQLIYCQNRNTEDAILTVICAVLEYLEKPKAFAWMFFSLFLVSIQHNPASPPDVEADGDGCQPGDHRLALQFPDR